MHYYQHKVIGLLTFLENTFRLSANITTLPEQKNSSVQPSLCKNIIFLQQKSNNLTSKCQNLR
jgi:hypothetical protein